MAASRNKTDPCPSHSGANGVGDLVTAAGSRIVAAIQEATSLLRSEGLGSTQLTVRAYEVTPPPCAYLPADVKRVRELLGVSQTILAAFLGVNVNTVRSWEQGKRQPQPMACRFLAEIESNPTYWRRRMVPSSE